MLHVSRSRVISWKSRLIIHCCKATCAKQMGNSQIVSIDLNRLELLGDSVLKLATSVYLYNTRPHNTKGELTEARTRRVSNNILSSLGRKKGITGTMQSTDFEKLGLLPAGYEAASKDFYRIIAGKNVADTVEALIGAHTVAGGLKGGINLMKWFGIRISNDCTTTMHVHVPHTQSMLFADSSRILSNYFGLPPPPSLTVSDKEKNSMMSGIRSIERGLRYNFRNNLLLIEAITHVSYSCNGTLTGRLKFLGDAILDYLVTCHIYQHDSSTESGKITELRSAIIRNSCFTELAASLDLHKYLCHNSPQLLENMTSYAEALEKRKNEELGIKFEELSINDQEVVVESSEDNDDMPDPPKSLSDCFESLAGAVFIDSGMNLLTVWKTFSPLLEPLFEKFKSDVPLMPIQELNFLVHNMTVKKEFYRAYCYVIEIDDKNICEMAIARSVRTAKNVAAAKVLKKLKETDRTNEPPVGQSQSVNEEFKNYFNNNTGNRGTKKQQQRKLYQRDPSLLAKRNCLLCFNSPQVEKHLIVSKGKYSYLALSREGLFDQERVLIIPFEHYPSSFEAPLEVIEEINQFKVALRNYFNSKDQTCVMFEHNYLSQHLQIQAVPFSRELESDVDLRRAFIDSGKANKLEFLEIEKGTKMVLSDESDDTYFMAEFYTGPSLLTTIKGSFPLQFGREVLASPLMLNFNLKSCAVDKELEAKITLRFKYKFQPFDFTSDDFTADN